MKTTRFSWLALSLLLLAGASCRKATDENDSDLLIKTPVDGGLSTLGSQLKTFCAEKTVALCAARGLTVGTLSIKQGSDKKVYVTYKAATDWYLSTVSLYAGSIAGVPVDKNQGPDLQKFPQKKDFKQNQRAQEYTFTFSNLPTSFVVVAHATVEKIVKGKKKEDQAVWGDGCSGQLFSTYYARHKDDDYYKHHEEKHKSCSYDKNSRYDSRDKHDSGCNGNHDNDDRRDRDSDKDQKSSDSRCEGKHDDHGRSDNDRNDSRHACTDTKGKQDDCQQHHTNAHKDCKEYDDKQNPATGSNNVTGQPTIIAFSGAECPTAPASPSVPVVTIPETPPANSTPAIDPTAPEPSGICSLPFATWFDPINTTEWYDVNDAEEGQVTVGGYGYTEAEGRAIYATTHADDMPDSKYAFMQVANLKLSYTDYTLSPNLHHAVTTIENWLKTTGKLSPDNLPTGNVPVEQAASHIEKWVTAHNCAGR